MTAGPLDALLDLVPHPRVLEHRTGGLQPRFRLSRLMAFEGVGIEEMGRAVPGVLATRVGLLTRTLRIDHDPKRIDRAVRGRSVPVRAP